MELQRRWSHLGISSLRHPLRHPRLLIKEKAKDQEKANHQGHQVIIIFIICYASKNLVFLLLVFQINVFLEQLIISSAGRLITPQRPSSDEFEESPREKKKKVDDSGRVNLYKDYIQELRSNGITNEMLSKRS